MKIIHVQSSKTIMKDRRRITSLRENIRSRYAALEEAKEHCQTGNEYLEESKKILERDRLVCSFFEIYFLKFYCSIFILKSDCS
jgi:hypothetical protein